MNESKMAPRRRRTLSMDAPARIATPQAVEGVLEGSGQQLDGATRAFMEPRFGHDFSQVRVHTDERAAESAEALNALAYTVGQDIAFAPGQYAPTTGDGQRLIAHELTHVVQQDQAGAVPEPLQLNVSQPGDPAEREADYLASRVTSRETASAKLHSDVAVARQADAGVAPAADAGAKSAPAWEYDPSGLFDDAHLNPDFKDKAKKALAAAVAGGLRPRPGEVYRTPETSAAYKSKGTSPAGAWESVHNYGLAMDVYLYDEDGGMIDSDNAKKHPDWYKQVKTFAQTYMSDFVWGEPINDTDHFEYHPGWSGLASGKTLKDAHDGAVKAAGGKDDYTEWIDYFWWKAGAGGKAPPVDAGSATAAPTESGKK